MCDTHSDGEDMGITELELLRVLLPRTCEHCSGLLVVDGYGDRLCSECGRSTFTPSAEVLADVAKRRRTPEGQTSYVRGLTGRSSKRGRHDAVAQGAVNGIVRRFA